MSLDVYLYGKLKAIDCTCETCGNKHKHETSELLFSLNITHNLGEMADHAGIYDALWRPENIGASTAFDLVYYLERGLDELDGFPETYNRYNAINGWGTRENLIDFVKSYLEACKANPYARIEVSR